MTLKEMLNQALLEIGFAPLGSFFTSTRQEARMLTALANRELNQLKKDDWQALRKTHTFQLTTDNLYPLPSDFRQFTPDTAFTDTRRVDFPASKELWAYYKASSISSGLNMRMRLTDGQIEILDPDPAQEVYIDYVSDSPVLSATDEIKPRFTSDDDTLILNDELFILGVVWRYMKVKGLDWQQSFAEYRSMYKRERGTDNGSQTLRLGTPEYDGPYPPHTNLWQ